MKAKVTIGIPASGKSSWADKFCAENPNWVEVNKDKIRINLFGERGYKPTKERERQVTEQQFNELRIWADAGVNVVISDTNLNPGHRANLEKYLKELGYEIEHVPFEIDLMEALRRDADRPRGVGYHTIHRMWSKWLDYTGFKRYTPNENLPEAIIVDIDGTLAERKDRGPYDWEKVGSDLRVNVVADMVEGLASLDYNVIVLSGRDGSCEDLTRKWLDENLVWWDALHMRAAEDKRKDSVVKQELFWEHVAPKYNIKAVIDDRPQVCRMWRDLGLKVIQVADPYKEF